MGKKVNTEVGAAMCGVSPGTFKLWRHLKKGPKFIKLGTSKQAGVCYDVDDIEAWLAERKFSSTTEYSAAACASAKARNGNLPPPRNAVVRPWENTTSADMPRRLFQMTEDRLCRHGWWPLRQLTALATGEGLIFQVRDPHTSTNGGKEFVDLGQPDKRLFCDVSEFAGVLAQGRRDGSTLTTVIRDAFDGVPLTIPTKTSFNQATDSHIVIVGSVPETEIVKNLNEVDRTNGFANRFPMFYSARSKIVPSPMPTDAMQMKGLLTTLPQRSGRGEASRMSL